MKVEKYNRNGWLVGQDSAPATAVISSSGDNEVAAYVPAITAAMNAL